MDAEIVLLLGSLALVLVLGIALWWQLRELTRFLLHSTGGLELIREGIANLIGTLSKETASAAMLRRLEAVEGELRAATAVAQDALGRATQLGARQAARARWDRDLEDEGEEVPQLTPDQKRELLAEILGAQQLSPSVPITVQTPIVRPGATSGDDSLKRRAFELRRQKEG